MDRGLLEEAVVVYRQAIALRPALPEAHSNLGAALTELGELEEAIAACRKAIALRPNYAEAHSNLGNALKDIGRLDEAAAAHRQATALAPHLPQTHVNLGNALKDLGRLDEAIAAYRAAIRQSADHADGYPNLLYTLPFHPAYDATAIAEELGRWNRTHAEPLRQCIRPHVNDRNPDRRLRIGYVSADFRDHVVGRNLLPLFRQHDRSRFEITCYAQVARADAVTNEFQRYSDRWRSLAGLSDEQAAEQIRRDEIDILVDLSLHMGGSRLLIFARKPAPVQVTFAGYPGSTGLTTIDYRLSDPYLDQVPAAGTPGADQSIYSEKTIRLSNSFWCYDPLDCAEIPISPLPALRSGRLTFGCLNNFCKVNDSILGRWVCPFFVAAGMICS
jgi:predicted O-linked N-acetylglucosamine transferase (SPINDLY family)